jgi:lysophospholipid acyltransferase (LPLAT)-like uncharacterized protein
MDDCSSFLIRIGGLLGATTVRAWMSTMDYRAQFFDRSVDGIFPSERQRIYVFWHEYILAPLYIRANCRLTMLLSRHRDADILYRMAYHMGFQCVRGSTFGGATEALLELSRRGQDMHLAITPDGPRGPRRKLAQGAVFLASKLQMPIVPLGFGIDRPWRTPTWDKFAIPRPGSRVRAIVGPEIFIPPNLQRDELELRRQGVERLLNDLGDDAEQWAVSGEQRRDAIPVFREGLRAENHVDRAADVRMTAGMNEKTVAVGARFQEQRAAG